MRIFHIQIILLIIAQAGYCQAYHPLPDSNVVWRISWGTSGCLQSNLFDEYQYQVTGDTNINASIYQKVVRTGSFDCHAAPILPESGYLGAYRNNLVTQQVFFVPKDSLYEMLLYDFSLNIGDTVKGYLDFVAKYNTAIISNIDSILIGSNYRKRWHYMSHGTAPYNFWNGTIIEGIGCEYGLLEGLSAMLDNNGSLSCFSIDNDVLYPINSPGPCTLISSTFNQKKENEGMFFCFPNPASGSIRVVGSGVEQIHFYKLYDALGRIILYSRFESNKSINIEHLETGTYFIELTDKKSRTLGSVKLNKLKP
ncbi:MAG: T9SS C-terminal target domain-containing protein [Bacteroidetes bacterium]|nr:MAG: T9SS C-terminal target domain-containing protein [Bacteroidota bacterium]REJ99737.1 MAG: T9SS C-terminal target domain-containing protein [Bacteroidota bacterium]REK32931.1 MAG: T9SS C-terminal target domain-containing protein [Bacteroidota bacterium]REK47736.1 MAG: T9SS C-terminal target domain-containing protein [Bacteroidota bacterium]